MKNIRIFVSENFQFLEVKVSIYLNRRVLVMVLQVLRKSSPYCPFDITRKDVFTLSFYFK